jgi:ribonuclease HII
MVKVLGIDEAGRGPVIGAMVMAGVMITEGDEHLLEGSKDSKMLAHSVRLELDKKIREGAEHMVIEFSPAEIDEALANPDMNLNWLEAKGQAELINTLKPDKAIIDCPSVNLVSFEAYLRGLLDNKEMELVVEHKADEKYITSSAASILAKVRREDIVSELKEKYGNTGSGYPADPKTKKFIVENWDKCPEIFRKSWSTYKKVVEDKGQSRESKFSSSSVHKNTQKELF